jgi:hypothetical protein
MANVYKRRNSGKTNKPLLSWFSRGLFALELLDLTVDNLDSRALCELVAVEGGRGCEAFLGSIFSRDVDGAVSLASNGVLNGSGTCVVEIKRSGAGSESQCCCEDDAGLQGVVHVSSICLG